MTDIPEWVNNGNTLIVVNNIEHWADPLAKKEVPDYRGATVIGTTCYGGNFFSKQHPLFNGLPQGCVFNWEYQCFATYRVMVKIVMKKNIVLIALLFPGTVPW